MAPGTLHGGRQGLAHVARPPPLRRSRIWLLAGGGLLLASALAAMWQWTGLAAQVHPAALYEWLVALRKGPAVVPAVWVGFVVAGFLVIPVNALFLAVGLAFDFLAAVALSLSGALCSALVLHQVGRLVDADSLLQRLPERLRRLKKDHLERASLGELALLRFLPLGPFTIMNLLWGAAGVPRRRLIPASVLGLLPGACLASAIGEGVGLTLQDVTAGNLALLVGALLAFLGTVWAGKRLVARVLD